MALHRKTNHRTPRRLRRYTTRMLGGARRPPPTDWLRLACRALEEVIRIDNRLRPYMAEQNRMLDNYWRSREAEAALRKVYGPPDPADPSPKCFAPPPIDIPQLLKDERANVKTQNLIALLQAKLPENGKQTVNKR